MSTHNCVKYQLGKRFFNSPTILRRNSGHMIDNARNRRDGNFSATGNIFYTDFFIGHVGNRFKEGLADHITDLDFRPLVFEIGGGNVRSNLNNLQTGNIFCITINT